MIEGVEISLRPAMEPDRRKVYRWMAESDVTPLMMGPPDFPDHPVPTFEAFCADYVPHYFDDSAPEHGRCFIIVRGGRDVGVVCHNEIDSGRRETELDIWLASRAECGQGTGTLAIHAICDHLRDVHGVERVFVRPSRRNERAIAAYFRSGFEPQGLSHDFESRHGPADYDDAVWLIKFLRPV